MLDLTDETLRVYEQRADRCCAACAPAVSADVACLLDAVVARLHLGSRVLEVGAGPGREAAYLEGRGMRVDRTDATAAFVERLREQGHDARLLDVRDGDLGGPYDAVLANAVLVHLDRARTRRALIACLRAVRAGGLLALTLRDGYGASWSDAKRGLPAGSCTGGRTQPRPGRRRRRPTSPSDGWAPGQGTVSGCWEVRSRAARAAGSRRGGVRVSAGRTSGRSPQPRS